MSDQKSARPKARAPRGFRDRSAAEIAAERACLDTIRRVFESWGFEALETPAFEYTDALGKFLPDLDRPNEGVFSLQDEDGQWLSLRYDLTAPLARYVAENFQHLPKPFRRYQVGSVWRNEKPGPGRYREFTQFDADTVGSASPAADAELLMMACDALQATGLGRDEFVIKFNNRKLLDGVLEASGLALGETAESRARRGVVLRAIDKLDRLGIGGVHALLGAGRKDESGDFTRGAGLSDDQIARIESFIALAHAGSGRLSDTQALVAGSRSGEEGLAELEAIERILGKESGITFDPGIVRGLDYYTGAVFEAQLTFPVTNDAGEEVVFGSVVGGGRYDDLVARFTGEQVPATGISIGVSRLLTALRQRRAVALPPLVLVLALDREDRAGSFAMAAELRAAGLRTETYIGEAGMKAQFKYADRRNAAVAIIEGSDERAKGEVTIKDLVLGAELAKSVGSRAAWVEGRPAQETVGRGNLVESVRRLLDRRG
ncbi:MAG TPA: histidine--tRNA ligase [Rhizomicrobium sp.]|jgi:histidyl-tRNA synthetase|nr:histidine--tRNA ligase [Rhizomicrobium sp.]